MASPRNLPVGSAVRAASAARAASPRPGSLPRPAAPASNRGRSSSRDRSPQILPDHLTIVSRPGSADVARRAMGGSPRIVMSPLHPRRGARGDGSLGPANAQEKELLEVCQQVAELAPQKFSNVREAFRYLRPDHNGKVSRSQVQYFFRAYGVERVQSDRLFEYFEPNENDDIDGHQFIDFFRQQINPADADSQGQFYNSSSRPSSRPQTPGSPAAAMHSASSDAQVARISNEFHYMLEELREKAPQRFSHVREALRIVDGDYDGCITRSEMLHFFRCFGIDEVRADRFFERMAKGGPGGANYHTFVQVVAPFLDLPGVAAAKQLPARPQSRPQSARSRPPSAGRRPSSSSRDRQESPVEIRSVLESALSTHEGSRLPVLPLNKGALESPASARRREVAAHRGNNGCESPLSARGRPCQQLSARRNAKDVRERSSSVCNSPRPVSGRNNGEPSQVAPEVLGLPMQPPQLPKHQMHQLALGNFKANAQDPFQERGVAYKPAPPPSSGRAGRRPMGIQRDVPGAEKAKDLTRAERELITASTNEALISGGRPAATPFRNPASEALVHCD